MFDLAEALLDAVAAREVRPVLLQVRQRLVSFVAVVFALFADPVDLAVLAREVVVQLCAVLRVGDDHTLSRLFRFEPHRARNSDRTALGKVQRVPRLGKVREGQVQGHTLADVGLINTVYSERPCDSER